MADLDAMVDIALTAMPMDPQWNWRFPYQSEYPEDTRLFTRWKYEEFLQDEGNWMVILAECEFANQPIAMAIWEVSALGYPKLHNYTNQDKLQPRCPRRDGHPARIQAWNDTMAKAKKSLFDDYHRGRHFQLQILATLPKFQGRGAGSLLCRWGIKVAESKGMPISVFASPMGRKLYSKLGFGKVRDVVVQVDADDLRVVLTAMSYEPTFERAAWDYDKR